MMCTRRHPKGPCPGGTNRCRCSLILRSVLALMLLVSSTRAPAQQQETKTSSPELKGAATQATNAEAEPFTPVPVLIDGEPVIWIIRGVGPYTPQMRAERISERIQAVISDRSIQDLRVTVNSVEDAVELIVAYRLLMVITQADAAAAGVARERIAQQYAQDLETAIRTARARHEPATLVRSSIFAGIATVVLVLILWLLFKVTNWLLRRLTGYATRWFDTQRGKKFDILPAGRLAVALNRFMRTFRFALILLLLNVYLTYVLGLFPWTRAVSLTLLEYLLAPLRAFGVAFVGYLPKLLFVILIVILVGIAIRAVSFFFLAVGNGKIDFREFPPEWADPTYKIVRLLLIAFGVVVAYPYLPASGSSAFAGVSVFLGLLISLASSTSLSNVIAGLVLTYTGAFRLGDFVKIGDAVGEIMKTSLLVTRIRTVKNEEITIPNATVLGSSVTNYSRKGKAGGLILHTSVTIGYDAPWRKVHDLLIQAALGTPGILPEPRPFVWQTALNDFYVTYEINAYTDAPTDMFDTYATLHARIQDSFYESGVEIMSPHYTSVRDGNTVAFPESYRPPDYRAPGFRIDHSSARQD